MEMSYLGIYEWVYRMVLDHIFTPVFDFVASLLNASIGWVFENLTGPIILPILQTVVEWIGRVYWFLAGIFMYAQYQWVLALVDYVEKAFDIFIGLTPVIYYPNGYEGGGVAKPLLETLFSMPAINNAFWLLTISGVAIAMLLTIYGVARSAFDLDFENKKPVSHVLSQMFKALVGAFLIPFMVVALLQMSSIILKTVDNAVSMGNDGEGSTLGSTLFVLSSVNASWKAEENMSKRVTVTAEDYGEQDIPFKLEVKDEVNPDFKLLADGDPRIKFYQNDALYNYKNVLSVGRYFNYGEFDYLTGIIAAIFMLIIMFLCLLTFIRRLFELLLLYLVSPYFVALIPLDDGERFKQWFSMFLGKLFTGFGSVMIMKIYLLLCPMIIGGGIQLENAGFETKTTMYLIFIVGGGWAVLKSGTVLTEIINSSAAQAERQSMNAAGGFLRSASDMAMAPLHAAKDIAHQSVVAGITESIREGRENRAERKQAALDSVNARNELAAQAKTGSLEGGKHIPPNRKPPLPPGGGKHIPPNRKPPLPPGGGGRHLPPNQPLPPTPGSKKSIPTDRPLPPIPGSGKRVPPNKPLPPTPGSEKRVPPNKPLPPTPGSEKRVPPNKPLPPTPGSEKRVPPNKPLPPTPGSGMHVPPNKPLPPTPGSRMHVPPNKPLPLPPDGGRLTPLSKEQTPKPADWKFTEMNNDIITRQRSNGTDSNAGMEGNMGRSMAPDETAGVRENRLNRLKRGTSHPNKKDGKEDK